MMRRAVFLLAAVLAGAALAVAPASAQSSGSDDSYNTLCVGFTVDNPSPTAGQTVHVTGQSATANATIRIELTGTLLGTTTSGADRSFAINVVIPASTIGAATLQAFQVGDNTDPLVGCPNEVLALDIVRPAAAAEPLARTGSNSSLPLARLGFGLLAAGGLVLLISRRRTSVSADS